MKSMIDSAKERLINGLEITKVKETARNYEITFSKDGMTTKGYLSKTCAPGFHNATADRTIYGAMSSLALQKKDVEDAQFWIDKILEIGRHYSEDEAKEGEA